MRTTTPATRWKILAAACTLHLLDGESAYAHDAGLDLTASFEQGFLHHITGVDHLIAMVAVGLLSGVLGGRAVVTVPALFVTFLLIGGVFGFYAFELVGVELWILASLLLLGVVLAGTAKPSRTLMFAAVALFGFAHGNAHGLELPLASSALGYAGGFAIASSVCHASGILVALGACRSTDPPARAVDRVRPGGNRPADGPSGSGKGTLLGILGGLDFPSTARWMSAVSSSARLRRRNALSSAFGTSPMCLRASICSRRSRLRSTRHARGAAGRLG